MFQRMINPMNRIVHKILIFSFLMCLFAGLISSCASKQTPAQNEDYAKSVYEGTTPSEQTDEELSETAGAPKQTEVSSTEAPASTTTATSTATATASAPAATQTSSENESIKLPSARPKSYFAKINDEIVKKVENGSSESISSAMSQIYRSDSDYSVNEKVLIYVAAEMTKTLWPSQKVTWAVYDVSSDTPYIGALNSVKKGIYDTSTGNTDFLTVFLPSLVLLTPNITANVQQQCIQGILAALNMNASSVAANYLAGVYYGKTGEYKKAEPYLAKAYEGSKVIEIALEYANTLSKNGNYVLAETVMKDAGQGTNSNLAVLKQNAWIAFEKGDYAAAEEYVARVLQQTPNDLEFVLFRAKIFIEKNDYIHAVSLLDMYARQNDTNLDYLILRAKVQLDWSKNTNAATETVEKAMQLYPNNIDSLLIAARLSSVTDGPVAGKYADELAAIVLEKDPSNNDALLYAMDGLIQRENWKEAYDISSRLLKAKSNDENLIFKHVTICLKLGKTTEAMELAKKAYAATPSSETIAQTYILASTQVLSREESLKLIDSMMNGASSKLKSYLYYRKSYLEHSEDTSLADLRSSLIANPRNSDALFRLYEIYYDKRDYRKAQYYLKQVVAINPNDSSVRKLNEALTQLVQ